MSHEGNEPGRARFLRSEPIFAVRDVIATVAYYQEVLGFSEEWLWGDPPDFGGVSWGKASVMFDQDPALADHVEGHSHFFFVEEVDALYSLHKANGAEILAPLEAKPWGLREYSVRDLNGYHLRFGEFGTEHTPSAPFPESVSIAERKPTVEEYLALIDAVGWSAITDRASAPRAIDNALHGVVALEGGRVVGTGLVVGDGAMFFYLKDVMVLPARQHSRIGSEIVAALMRYIRGVAAPHALVGLFTGRNLSTFYERFGFKGADEGVYGMTLRIEPPS